MIGFGCGLERHPVVRHPHCDYWLPSRSQCDEVGVFHARDQHGAPFRFCPQHWRPRYRPDITAQYGALTPIPPTDPAAMVRAYRAWHVIEPEHPSNARLPSWCRTCGVDIYPIKGGWRHDSARVAVLDADGGV